jgi:ketosteroid isomerase-like protein
MNQEISQFLRRCEQATAASDFAAIGKLYADTFMFGGVNGTKVVRKEDFLKVLPGMKAHFASMGVTETKLRTVEGRALDARYVLAKAGWKMTLLDSSGGRNQVDAFATYILERKKDGTLSILFQIDHQDLAAAVKNRQST